LAAAACAAGPAPIARDHPIIGVWRFEVPDTGCVETYIVRADGTTATVSAAERSESAFEISAQPSARGFYRWTDRITRNNGKPDCGGGVTEIGRETTLYVRMSNDKSWMILCAQEDLRQCMGPLARVEGRAL
jgi:hypothetical protein